MTGSVTEYRVPEMDGREVCGGVGGAGGQNLTVERSVVEYRVLGARI